MKAPGNSRCWISASDNGTERWPHSKRSVYRRFAITTYGQEVGRLRHIRHRLLSGEVLEHELQNADSFTAAGHRREQRSAAILVDHLDCLGGERPAVRRPDQGHALRSLLPLQTPFPAGVAQSDQRLPAEVGDQEADLAGIDRLRQRAGEHIGRATGGAAATAASNEFRFNDCRL